MSFSGLWSAVPRIALFWKIFSLMLVCSNFLSTLQEQLGTDGNIEESMMKIAIILPNPWEYPADCGRSSVERSAICDPHHYLVDKRADEVEGYLNQMDSAFGAVAIVQKIDPFFIRSEESIIDATARVSKYLLRAWNVGGLQHSGNGFLLFLSILDRSVYISVGSEVLRLISERDLQSILSNMKPRLRDLDYGSAVFQAIVEMDLLLKERKGALNAPTSHDKIDDYSRGGFNDEFSSGNKPLELSPGGDKPPPSTSTRSGVVRKWIYKFGKAAKSAFLPVIWFTGTVAWLDHSNKKHEKKNEDYDLLGKDRATLWRVAFPSLVSYFKDHHPIDGYKPSVCPLCMGKLEWPTPASSAADTTTTTTSQPITSAKKAPAKVHVPFVVGALKAPVTLRRCGHIICAGCAAELLTASTPTGGEAIPTSPSGSSIGGTADNEVLSCPICNAEDTYTIEEYRYAPSNYNFNGLSISSDSTASVKQDQSKLLRHSELMYRRRRLRQLYGEDFSYYYSEHSGDRGRGGGGGEGGATTWGGRRDRGEDSDRGDRDYNRGERGGGEEEHDWWYDDGGRGGRGGDIDYNRYEGRGGGGWGGGRSTRRTRTTRGQNKRGGGVTIQINPFDFFFQEERRRSREEEEKYSSYSTPGSTTPTAAAASTTTGTARTATTTPEGTTTAAETPPSGATNEGSASATNSAPFDAGKKATAGSTTGGAGGGGILAESILSGMQRALQASATMQSRSKMQSYRTSGSMGSSSASASSSSGSSGGSSYFSSSPSSSSSSSSSSKKSESSSSSSSSGSGGAGSTW